jgi:hypothetical protein
MGEVDQGIKYLLQLDAPNMLAYTVPGLNIETTLPSEVTASPQLLPDTLFRGTYQGDLCIVNLEVQAGTGFTAGHRTRKRAGTFQRAPLWRRSDTHSVQEDWNEY